MKMLRSITIIILVVLSVGLANAKEVKFNKTVVDTTFRSEGVAVGDVNHDGKLDILAGDVWYSAPDWKMHEVCPIGKYESDKGYSDCFANFAQDVDGDGWVDSIVIGMPGGPCLWYRNPQNKEGHWAKYTIAPSACNETPVCLDLLNNGKPVPLFACQPEGIMAWFGKPTDPTKSWDMHVIAGPKAPGTDQFSHGLGVGDINGDGRNDVLVIQGWWEAPQDRTQTNWKFHQTNLGPGCADMLVYDIDADGDNDVITSAAHNYGIWWFEQKPGTDGPQFEQHEIFKEFSQPHAIRLADIDNDGDMDLVTGKRYFAHLGHDPGGKEPAVLYWFELLRLEKGKVEFIPHKIDDDSGVGTQFEVVDFNKDGKIDIVASNKKGVHFLIQQ